jgi:hypothetical protein
MNWVTRTIIDLKCTFEANEYYVKPLKFEIGTTNLRRTKDRTSNTRIDLKHTRLLIDPASFCFFDLHIPLLLK